MTYSSLIRTAVIALLLAALAGCTGTPSKTPIASSETKAETEMTRGDFQQALTALKQGKDDDAITLFNAVAQSRPDLAAPYINIGLMALKRGDLQQAETALQHAATLKPELAMIHNSLGILYRHSGRFAEAEAAYLKALQCQPDYANAHLNLGILYEIYLSKPGAALTHYQRYQELSGETNEMTKKWIIDLQRRLTEITGSSN